MNRVLIVGCGYVGLALARQRRAAGDAPPLALTRSDERVAELCDAGLEPIVGHWHDAASLHLPPVDTVLVSVPHREDGGWAIESHVHGLKNLLQALPTGWSKLIYLSTTGVYGDAHEVVDENTPTQPTRIGPQIAVAAEQFLEQQWHARAVAQPQLTILRLAGIYGPGRIPLAEKLRSGQPLQVPQDGWLNLAHVDDIAAMLSMVMGRPLHHELYVFSDAHAVRRIEFYRHLASLCGVDEPQFAAADPSSSRGRRAGNKRVDPQRLVRELDFKFRFPSYREGLADCLAQRN